jgi:2-polyprenyl-3-methyl-5-hydroxy-6-metoxy-1,4-benzoquinol methylase
MLRRFFEANRTAGSWFEARLPLEANEADMIVSRSVLEHLTDLQAFVMSSAKVLEPGGYFTYRGGSRPSRS